MIKGVAAVFASALLISGCSSNSSVTDLGAAEFVTQSQAEGVVLNAQVGFVDLVASGAIPA